MPQPGMSRILIGLTPKLLRGIDEYTERHGYASRCEAIRAIMSNYILRWEMERMERELATPEGAAFNARYANSAMPPPASSGPVRNTWRPPAPGMPEEPVLATEEQAQWVARNFPAHAGWPLNPGKLELPNISYTAGDCRRYERTSQLPDIMLPLRDDCYAWITAHDPPWRARMDKQDREDGIL
jgi:Arc/MetJ-type ribon-helix-helix transcriptional regulator